MSRSPGRSWLKALIRSWFPVRPVRQKRRSRPLIIEHLEDRVTPSGYTVSNTSYSGTGSLGAAIGTAITNHDNAAVITFSGVAPNSTIQLISTDTSATTTYGPTGYVINGASGTNITIDGSGAPGLVINGGNAVRLFAVTAGNTLELKNLTLEGGLAQGAAGGGNGFFYAGGGGGGAGLGGAVFDDGGAFTALGCTFTNNKAQGGTGGSPTNSNSENSGGGGGGGLSGDGPAGGNNLANGAGGAFGAGGGGGGGKETAHALGGAGGSGGFGGGGGGGGQGASAGTGHGGNGGLGGFGGGGGGGGDGEGGNHYKAPGGTGGFGGGNGGHGTTNDDSAGGGGGGAGLGGGIFSNAGTLTLTNDTFSGNTAIRGTAATQFEQGTNGDGYGGAVFLRNGTLNATFDTFSGNTAAQGGTDLYVLSDASKGGNNTSPGSGTASATLINDILGQTSNAVTDFVANTNSGGNTPTFTGSSNDLVRSGGAVLGAAVISTADPSFATAAPVNNGGPTPTLALTTNSTAALGKATTNTGITVDQRGRTRSAPPDLGAYQFTSPGPRNFVVNVLGDNSGSAAGTPSSDNNPLHGDLRYVLNQAIEDQTADSITFDPTVFATAETINLNHTLDTDPTSVGVFSQTAFVIGGTANIALTGPAAGVTLNGGGAVRLFAVTANASLTLDDLTLTGGLATGGTAATEGGGGLGAGGAVFDDGGSFTAQGCTFTNDDAKGGAGGGLRGNGGGGGGLGGGSGTAAGANGGHGGGFNGGSGPNYAVGGKGGFGGGGGEAYTGAGGGGGFGGGGGVGASIAGPGGFGGGGAGVLGSGGFGGGGGGTPDIGGGGGGGAGLGGGVFSNGGSLVLTNDTFTADSAAGGAGGGAGSAGDGYGGAVFMRNGTLNATFDTFSGNTAAQGGTDLYVLSDGSNGGNNTSPGSGTASATLINDILGQTSSAVADFVANTNGGGSTPTFTGSSNDLVRSGGGVLGAAVISTADPSFATAAPVNNGGPTPTLALTTNSTAALGQGATNTGITLDQRGRTRSATPDLGAYQFTSPGPRNFVVNVLGDNSGSAAGTPSSDNNPLHGDLRYVLNQAIEDQTADSITFDSTVFSAVQTITLKSSLVTEPLGFANPYGQTGFIIGAGDNITITGSAAGVTISGNSATRLFVVEGGGTLDLNNLTVSGGNATGGKGGDGGGGGGGGGAGLGGAVLVDGSTFTAAGCTFVNNKATGGAGGGTSNFGGGGGGGGLGPPNAGNGSSFSAGMGGGLNGGRAISETARGGGGYGSNGGFGGGGGAGFGGYGDGPGGNGGFGGGGGGAAARARDGRAGGGGFGGGGGGSHGESGTFGQGGFGGGAGAGFGGGGAGLGGAVFSTAGTITLTNDTFALDTAKGGAAGSANAPSANDGQGDGGAVFVRNGMLTATFDTFSSNTVKNGDSSNGTASDVYVVSDNASGSGFTAGSATATLINNILGQNGTPDGISDFYAGVTTASNTVAPTLTGSTNNLVSNNPGSGHGLIGTVTGTNPNFSTGGLNNTGLASNGGPTQTIALTSSSTTALERGAPGTGISIDQRGTNRISPPDVGAYQFVTQAVTISPGGASAGSADSLPPATETINYNSSPTITVSGGSGSYSSVTPSGLPSGLSLKSLGNNQYAIQGNPLSTDTVTTYSISITATDSQGVMATAYYSLLLNAPPGVTFAFLGNNTQSAPQGASPVLPGQGFNASTGYGWIGTPPSALLRTGSIPPLTSPSLGQDQSIDYDTKPRTFGYNLTAGTYEVTVIQGDYYTLSPGQHSNMSVTAYEDNTLGSPLGGVSGITVPYEQFASNSFQVKITGTGTHTLELVFAGSNDYWVLNDLFIRSISAVQPISFTEMGQTATATGTTIDEFKGTIGANGLTDGSLVTVATTLGTIVGTNSSFSPVADASALYTGVQATVTGDTFYFELVETGGLGTANLSASEVNGLAVTGTPTAVNFTPPSFRNIAFRASNSGSLAAFPSYIALAPATEFTSTTGYGWNGTPAAFSVDRGLTAQPNAVETGIQFDTGARTFSVLLAPGCYTVTAVMGDTAVGHSNMGITASQGAQTFTIPGVPFNTAPSNHYTSIVFTAMLSGTQPLNLTFSGSNNYWVLSDLTFAKQTLSWQVAASEAAASKTPVPTLTQAELQPIVSAAIARYAEAGLDAKDLALLRSVTFQITDLRSQGLLGDTPIGGHVVTLDSTGAGYGWYIDATPNDDNGFVVSDVASTQLNATSSAAIGHYDLLTVVMHELGHVLGEADVANASAPGNLMDMTLSLGVRRLPTGDTAVFTAGSSWTAVADTLHSRN